MFAIPSQVSMLCNININLLPHTYILLTCLLTTTHHCVPSDDQRKFVHHDMHEIYEVRLMSKLMVHGSLDVRPIYHQEGFSYLASVHHR